MKLEIKKQTNKQTNTNTIITQACHSRDAAPESYQVRPESLETFQPASSKVKNEKSDFRL